MWDCKALQESHDSADGTNEGSDTDAGDGGSTLISRLALCGLLGVIRRAGSGSGGTRSGVVSSSGRLLGVGGGRHIRTTKKVSAQGRQDGSGLDSRGLGGALVSGGGGLSAAGGGGGAATSYTTGDGDLLAKALLVAACRRGKVDVSKNFVYWVGAWHIPAVAAKSPVCLT